MLEYVIVDVIVSVTRDKHTLLSGKLLVNCCKFIAIVCPNMFAEATGDVYVALCKAKNKAHIESLSALLLLQLAN